MAAARRLLSRRASSFPTSTLLRRRPVGPEPQLRPTVLAAATSRLGFLCGMAWRRGGHRYSLMRSGGGGGRVPTEMAPLFPGCDYEHWLIVMDKPGWEGATMQQMVDCYIQTLAKVVRSEEEAKKKIYNVSCERYFGSGARSTRKHPTSWKFCSVVCVTKCSHPFVKKKEEEMFSQWSKHRLLHSAFFTAPLSHRSKKKKDLLIKEPHVALYSTRKRLFEPLATSKQDMEKEQSSAQKKLHTSKNSADGPLEKDSQSILQLGSTVIELKTKDDVVLAVEKHVISPLLLTSKTCRL